MRLQYNCNPVRLWSSSLWCFFLYSFGGPFECLGDILNIIPDTTCPTQGNEMNIQISGFYDRSFQIYVTANTTRDFTQEDRLEVYFSNSFLPDPSLVVNDHICHMMNCSNSCGGFEYSMDFPIPLSEGFKFKITIALNGNNNYCRNFVLGYEKVDSYGPNIICKRKKKRKKAASSKKLTKNKWGPHWRWDGKNGKWMHDYRNRDDADVDDQEDEEEEYEELEELKPPEKYEGKERIRSGENNDNNGFMAFLMAAAAAKNGAQQLRADSKGNPRKNNIDDLHTSDMEDINVDHHNEAHATNQRNDDHANEHTAPSHDENKEQPVSQDDGDEDFQTESHFSPPSSAVLKSTPVRQGSSNRKQQAEFSSVKSVPQQNFANHDTEHNWDKASTWEGQADSVDELDDWPEDDLRNENDESDDGQGSDGSDVSNEDDWSEEEWSEGGDDEDALMKGDDSQVEIDPSTGGIEFEDSDDEGILEPIMEFFGLSNDAEATE